MSHSRFLGEGLNPSRPQALRTRAFRKAFFEALEDERIRLGGRLTLTFEIVYGHAFKGMPKLKNARGDPSEPARHGGATQKQSVTLGLRVLKVPIF
jgi:hypothetical protein